jgi:hypothetical protein
LFKLVSSHDYWAKFTFPVGPTSGAVDVALGQAAEVLR